jgi:hypothetical protein
VSGLSNALSLFRTRLEAETWAARTEARAYGRTLVLGREVTLAQLIDEVGSKLRRRSARRCGYGVPFWATCAWQTSRRCSCEAP